MREARVVAPWRVALRVRVPGEVHPDARPAFTIVGRGEQPVDHPSEGLGTGVGEEGLDVCFSRRQAGQVEGGPADEGAFVGDRVGRETSILKPGEDKGIDGRLNPRIG